MLNIKHIFCSIALSFFGFDAIAQDYQEMISKGTYSVYEIQKSAEKYFDQVGRGKGTGYKQYKRWEYQALQEADKNGFLKNHHDDYQKLERFQQDYYRKNANKRVQHTGNWQDLGPTYWNATSGWNPGVGRITSLAVDENNNNHIIIGANTGGVWKTTNKGQTWTPISDKFSTMDVGALAMDQQNSNTYYWGGSDGDVYKSTNGGASWTKIGSISGTVIRILVHPSNSSVLFSAGDYGGIYKSTNGGTSWTKVITTSRGYDIEFKPGDPNTVYASGTGFYKSTDGGTNFTQVTTGSGVQMIGVSAKDPNRVYVLEASGGQFGGIYRSTNSGTSFTKLTHTKNYFGYSTTGDDQIGQAPRDMAIAVSPTNADEVHIAGILTWRSTNGGTSFSCTSDWTPSGASGKNIGYCHADVDDLFFHGDTLYAITDGGIFIAENTATVSKNYYKDLTAGLSVRQFYKIGVSQSEIRVVSGGSQDNGTSVLKESTSVWYDWLGADGMESFVDWNNTNILYGTSQYGSLYRSTNGGQSQSRLSSPDGKEGNWVTPFEQDPTVSTTIYVGYDQVYKSTNSGTSWTPISQNFGGKLDELKIAKSNNKIMFASQYSRLYKTTTGSGTWTQLTGISGRINSIAIHPKDPNRIAVATSGEEKVYVSTNGGTSWTSYKKNLPDMTAFTVIWDETEVNALYLGMNYGVYYIDNNLSDWEPFMTGMPNVKVAELDINYKAQKIYAGTHGRGLWMSDLRSSK
ncbi:VPS10 domain-containing protein [Candidatus Electronema sp. PJ]|uniref:WD40/YVTN/BNR-like repeat-containing protein n=1 Tax=Candidatus Electronema sp. PJ TaxID=3401572 RepID=UPI003AA8F723